MKRITGWSHIRNNYCIVSGKELMQKDESSPDDFAKQLFKSLKIDYPKFYKMDSLCKLAFTGVELLKPTVDLSKYADDEIALFFSNTNSSGDVDSKYQTGYLAAGGTPSPALFVYTLPNVLLGELAIRNKFYGENLFTIQPKFDADYFSQYCRILMQEKSKACLCGWVDVNGQNLDTFIFVVENSDNESYRELTELNLIELYNL